MHLSKMPTNNAWLKLMGPLCHRACCVNSLKGAFVSTGNRAAVALWIKHIWIYFYASEVNSCLLHYINTERETLFQ